MNEEIDSPINQGLTVQDAIDLAVQRHTAGRLSEAEYIYNQILEADPNQPVALHLLGVVAHQVGKNKVAADLIGKAIAIRPDYAEAHSNLGAVLKEQGKLDEAVASYRKAIAIQPDYAEAHSNLGSVLQEKRKLDEAVTCYHKALAIKPDYAEGFNNLGSALQEQGKLDEAVTSYHKALAIKPDYAETLYNLGAALKEQGKLDEAVTSYYRALATKPDFTEAHSNLGVALKEQGELDKAVASYHKALAIKPDYAEAHSNLGAALQEQGKFEEAVASCHKALAIKPDYAEGLYNLGNVLQEQGKLDEAVTSYHKALAIKPDYAEAQVSLVICDWVQREQKNCIIHLSNINPKSILRESRFCISYYTLLQKLTRNYAENPQKYRRVKNIAPIYAIGESHCLPPAHTTVILNEMKYRIEPKLITGCQAWHLGNTYNNKFKVQFERIANSLASGVTTILMFGEIDCRPDDGGILAEHKKTRCDLSKSISEIVKSYVKYVTIEFAPRGITPIFYGVPARITRKDAEIANDETKLSFIIREFNQALAKETKRRNITFLDVYSLTNDADGQASGAFHLDAIHVIPSVLGDLTKQA